MASPAKDLVKRVEKLRSEIDRHNHLYYIESRPEISDRDFDKLLQGLIDLEKAHPELITPDSPTQRVGGEVQSELKPVRHTVPMMSIENTYSEDEVRAFDERVRRTLDGQRPVYVLEPKIDGASISLRYEKGKFVQAATRGRGNVGEDITVNARTIQSIPLTLRDQSEIPRILEVRGEVYMNNDDFQRLNKEIVAEGEEPYANPRNLTSGTLRTLDPKVVARRRLRFLAHGLGKVDPMPADKYWEWTQLLRKWGLPLPKEVWRVKGIDEAIEKIHEFEKIRPKLPYMTDGMVMKVDAFAERDQLGATSKAPRWVIAYKYETEQQPTVLRDVRWQVGKGGNLTPVGLLEPVFVGGVTVSNVTLHNIDQIKRLDLHIGDTIIIERAGEVIPYVVEAMQEKRPKGAKQIEPPTKCPSCGSKVEREADTPYIRCVNPACPAQLKERLRWFCGRTQMDIEGLGDVLVDQLVEKKLVHTFADLYKLKADDIATLQSEVEQGGKTVTRTVGEKVAKKVIENIEASRKQSLDRLLAGIGIPHVGTTNAKDLAAWAGTLDHLLNASEDEVLEGLAGSDKPLQKKEKERGIAKRLKTFLDEQSGEGFFVGASDRLEKLSTREFLEKRESQALQEILGKSKERRSRLATSFPWLGDLLNASRDEVFESLYQEGALARSVAEFFHSAGGRKAVLALQRAGIDPKFEKVTRAKQSELTDKTVVITGSIPGFTRDELKEQLERLGAHVSSAVSSKTDLLIAGEEPGSKLQKAEALGVRIWNAEEVSQFLAKSKS